MRFSPISHQINTCKFCTYIYLAGVLAICHSFLFYFEIFFPIFKSVCQDKIASDDLVMGQCVLLGNLTSLVLPLSCFFHGCSDRRMANFYVYPQNEWVSLYGQTAQHEVLPPSLLQVSQLPEKAISSQEERVPFLELDF